MCLLLSFPSPLPSPFPNSLHSPPPPGAGQALHQDRVGGFPGANRQPPTLRALLEKGPQRVQLFPHPLRRCTPKCSVRYQSVLARFHVQHSSNLYIVRALVYPFYFTGARCYEQSGRHVRYGGKKHSYTLHDDMIVYTVGGGGVNTCSFISAH